MKPIRYIALLRGINVGGHKQVKMEELKKTLESLGFQNVKTMLNSGNVIFEIDEINSSLLKNKIEAGLKSDFGHEIAVLLRTHDELRALQKADPFKDIKGTPEARLYVTFFSEKPVTHLKLHFETPEKDFKVVRVSDREICTVLTLSKKRGTTDSMDILEKTYGKKVTTRNWNTVIRLLS